MHIYWFLTPFSLFFIDSFLINIYLVVVCSNRTLQTIPGDLLQSEIRLHTLAPDISNFPSLLCRSQYPQFWLLNMDTFDNKQYHLLNEEKRVNVKSQSKDKWNWPIRKRGRLLIVRWSFSRFRRNMLGRAYIFTQKLIN